MMKGQRSHERRPSWRRYFLAEAALRSRRSHGGPAYVTRRRLVVVACIHDSMAPRHRGLCSRLDTASPSLPCAPAFDSMATRRPGPSLRLDVAAPTPPLVTPQRLAIVAHTRDSMPHRHRCPAHLPQPSSLSLDSALLIRWGSR
jgi:hypothetical protein